MAEGDELQSVVDHFRSLGLITDKGFPDSVEEWLNNFELVNPAKHVAEIAPRPLLLVHGSQDEVVDVSHAYKLYSQAAEPEQIIIVGEVGHRLRQNERAMAIVINWLKTQAKFHRYQS